MKKLIAGLFLALGLSGAAAAVAPTPASAQLPVCVRVNVTIFGTRVGTGSNFICVPPG